MNGAMSGALTAWFEYQLPRFYRLFDTARVGVRVVDARRLFNAHVLRDRCREGHDIVISVIASNLLFLVWRLFMILAAAAETEIAEGHSVRIRFRPPALGDVDDLQRAIDGYVGGAGVDAEDLRVLEAAVLDAPKTAAGFLSHTCTLSELLVMLHEIAHELAQEMHGAHRRVDLSTFRLNPEREAAWADEIRMDLLAADMAYSGLVDKRLGIAGPSLDAEARMQCLCELAVAGVGMYHAQFIAERAILGAKLGLLSPRVDPHFTTHPPALVRREAFRFWVRQEVEARGSRFDGPVVETVERWFAELEALHARTR